MPVPPPVLQLLRPANVVTAAADVLAGFAVAGAPDLSRLPWLIASSACLYAGGVVLNDVFDRRVDAVERPERPIPSGRIAVSQAIWLGSGLMAAGLASARGGGPTATAVAAGLVAAVLLYNGLAKAHAVAGPILMGTCRGLNFALGMAVSPAALTTRWPLALFAVVYVAGVTLMSHGEVTGGRRRGATVSLGLVAVSVVGLALLAATRGTQAPLALALSALLAARVLPAFWFARQRLEAVTIQRAVGRGVLSLVLLDAALTAAYAGTGYAAAVLATGLAAGSLARFFAVT